MPDPRITGASPSVPRSPSRPPATPARPATPEPRAAGDALATQPRASQEAARRILDDLAKIPAPPADTTGKIQWLADARPALTRARVADAALGGKSSELKALEARVRQVEREVFPTRATGSSSQLFELTKGASELASSESTVAQAAGVVALPIAVTIDVLDLISRLNAPGARKP
ncbi:MAG TPA: hypothetical protein V6D00_10335 [Pantanalinema sp.]